MSAPAAVWLVVGIREQVQWEDPGAEETLSVHATREGAEAACSMLWREPLGYFSYEVRQVEVKP